MNHLKTNGRTALALSAVAGTAAVLAGAAGYWYGLRPRMLRWGATEAEARRALPGDDLVPQPKRMATRAVTIQAPAAVVWPWLIQIGQDRGGLYSYDWLENLAGCDIHSADGIVPEFALKVGDKVRLGPEGYPFFVVLEMQPERALLLGAGPAAPERVEGTWLFYLDPIDPAHTRLIVRSRGDHEPTLMNYIMWEGLVDPINFVMERKMMLGIKERAEGARPGVALP
jgi:hypothetical protein